MISYEKRTKKFVPIYNVPPEVIEDNYQRVMRGEPLTIPLRHLGKNFKTRCRVGILHADTRTFFKCLVCGKVMERAPGTPKFRICSKECRIEQRRKRWREYYYRLKSENKISAKRFINRKELLKQRKRR